MRIPLRYNTGSLWARRTGTAMTIIGIGLTVSIFVTMTALVAGPDYFSTWQDLWKGRNVAVRLAGPESNPVPRAEAATAVMRSAAETACSAKM